ncbi:uncharacterized protein E0L32_009641 [Thyridium curvatum]|uniref:Uncharacterized protein n=1 Tax=Thyridium curvatum TaxID=1093900 RepID=A0A507ANQ8_9PEZI|nr:uncharacterized protein E0L32_009641 [Thyridium curvatum]TPX08937.1 hypothetical protein E0L32_009641 [Thyridium curvatum]
MVNLPYTPADWRRTMAEIKRQHQSKRYRACSARCTEILDNLKDLTRIEPAHLIYLHFYAAHSMEMCARALFNASPYRAQLLDQARTHYDRAAALIEKAEDSVTAKTRSSSRASSISSCHSPSGSVSSQAWSVDTGISSPARSVCSFEDLASKSQPQTPVSPVRPIKKKVSFSLPEPEKEEPVPEAPVEPFIRPDSPTLGIEDEYLMFACGRKELPKPPEPAVQVVQEAEEEEEEETTPRASVLPTNPFDDALDQFHQFRDSFALLGSVNRYCDHLSTLKFQLASHSSNLNTLLEDPRAEDEHPPLAAAAGTSASTRAATPAGDEARSLDKQARIERLRRNGWQRKRFDPRRYEQLCNSVMAEMS